MDGQYCEYLRTYSTRDPKQAHKVRVDPSQDLTLMPRAFRGPRCICSHSTYAVSNIEVNLRPMALRAMGHGHSGTLPAAPAQKKFLLVATDYFSKWVEAEAYASIKDKDHRIQEFLFGAEHPEFILHTAHKQDPNHCLKEKA
ncbi:hypothetical protein AAG906_037004 [Vitis piasezkii]